MPNKLTVIGSYCFMGCNNLKNVILPEGLLSIGASSFRNCLNLESIQIASTVSSILNDSFTNCPKLKQVHITNLNNYLYNITNFTLGSCPTINGADLILNGSPVTTVTLSLVRTFLFAGCTSIQTVFLENGVTSIGGYAFYLCKNILNLNLPDTVSEIQAGAFRGTGISSFVIPEGVTVANTHILNDTPLENITIPSTIVQCNDNAFYSTKTNVNVYISDLEAWCRINFDAIHYRSNPLANGGYLYLNGEELTELIVPNGITSLSSAFFACKSITKL